jgi:hypothetical protein
MDRTQNYKPRFIITVVNVGRLVGIEFSFQPNPTVVVTLITNLITCLSIAHLPMHAVDKPQNSNTSDRIVQTYTIERIARAEANCEYKGSSKEHDPLLHV